MISACFPFLVQFPLLMPLLSCQCSSLRLSAVPAFAPLLFGACDAAHAAFLPPLLAFAASKPSTVFIFARVWSVAFCQTRFSCRSRGAAGKSHLCPARCSADLLSVRMTSSFPECVCVPFSRRGWPVGGAHAPLFSDGLCQLCCVRCAKCTSPPPGFLLSPPLRLCCVVLATLLMLLFRLPSLHVLFLSPARFSLLLVCGVWHSARHNFLVAAAVPRVKAQKKV